DLEVIRQLHIFALYAHDQYGWLLDCATPAGGDPISKRELRDSTEREACRRTNEAHAAAYARSRRRSGSVSHHADDTGPWTPDDPQELRDTSEYERTVLGSRC